MSDVYDDLKSYIEEISEHYRQLAGDGKLSFGDAMLLMGKASASFIQLVERFTDLADGVEKKEIVLKSLGVFYDEVIRPLDIQSVPNLAEPIVDTALRQLVLTVAGAGIDTIVAIFNRTGWQTDPVSGPQAHQYGSLPAEENLPKEVVVF